MVERRGVLVAGALVAVLGLLGGACGGDGDDGVSGSDAAVDDGGDATGGGDCATTDLTFTNRATGTSFEATSTAAVSLVDGAAYTAYAADFDLDLDAISFVSNPEVPPDGNLATIAVTIFNPEDDPEPLEVGQVVTHDSSQFGVLTFVVTANEGEELFGNSLGGEGEITITGVGDRFCFDVDYRDDEKELTGTLSAPVKPL